MLATFALGFFMSIFILYGFDTAGHVRRGDGRRGRAGAARRALRRSLISGAVGVVFLLAIILSLKDIPASMAEGLAGGFPIATTITGNLHGADRQHHVRRPVPVRHPRVGVRLHARDPRRGDADDVLDEPRQAPAARAGAGATSTAPSGPRPTPHRGRRPGRDPDPPGRAARRLHAVDRGHRPDLPQLLPVQPRRRVRAQPGLAAPAGLVQPRPMGDAGQHPRPHLRRDHDRQHRAVGEPAAVRRLRFRRPQPLEPADQRAVHVQRGRRSTGCLPGRSTKRSSASCSWSAACTTWWPSAAGRTTSSRCPMRADRRTPSSADDGLDRAQRRAARRASSRRPRHDRARGERR